MLMKYDEKPIKYELLETQEENKIAVMLSDKIKVVFNYYETATENILIVCVDVYVAGVKVYDIGFFYFEDNDKSFNMREIIKNKRHYKAEKYLTAKREMLTAFATIFKDAYTNKNYIPLF